MLWSILEAAWLTKYRWYRTSQRFKLIKWKVRSPSIDQYRWYSADGWMLKLSGLKPWASNSALSVEFNGAVPSLVPSTICHPCCNHQVIRDSSSFHASHVIVGSAQIATPETEWEISADHEKVGYAASKEQINTDNMWIGFKVFVRKYKQPKPVKGCKVIRGLWTVAKDFIALTMAG